MSKLQQKLDAWGYARQHIARLRADRLACECEIDVDAYCRMSEWPEDGNDMMGYRDLSHREAQVVCRSETDWCEECLRWLDLIVEEKDARIRLRALTTALMRMWRIKVLRPKIEAPS